MITIFTSLRCIVYSYSKKSSAYFFALSNMLAFGGTRSANGVQPCERCRILTSLRFPDFNFLLHSRHWTVDIVCRFAVCLFRSHCRSNPFLQTSHSKDLQIMYSIVIRGSESAMQMTRGVMLNAMDPQTFLQNTWFVGKLIDGFTEDLEYPNQSSISNICQSIIVHSSWEKTELLKITQVN